MTGSEGVAVVPVRGGALPAGADEAVAEAGGRALVIGDEAAAAARHLAAAERVLACEAGPYRPAGWAVALAPLLAAETVVVLPASPDGRDLAPRLARTLGRPLLAGAVRIRDGRVSLSRGGGRVVEDVAVEGPVVVTLVPGVRGAAPLGSPARIETCALAVDHGADPEVLEVLPPDPAGIDLAEAHRIVAGGQGLPESELFALLGAVGGAIGASLGGTRVASDAGWIPGERQIGTTGVAVSPQLYLAFGISGATQHTTGIGHPDHIVSVNLDGSCPMMAMADLALVSDAPAVVRALAAKLGVDGHDDAGGGRL